MTLLGHISDFVSLPFWRAKAIGYFKYIFPMKRLLRLLALAGLLFLGWLITPFLLPETMTVRHSVWINAPASTVYAQLNDFRNWEYWSPWNIEREMPQPLYHNGGFGQGGVAVWQAPGETGFLQRFTITKSEPHRLIEVAMDYTNKAFCVSRTELSESDGATLVSWALGVKTEGWKTLFFRMNAPKTLKKASANLLKTAELWHEQGLPVVEQGAIEEFPFVSIRRQIAWEDLSDDMAEMYDQLIKAGTDGNYTITGHPYAIYHSMGEERVDLECGFPVESAVQHQGIILSGMFSEAMCAVTEYTGNYENLESGHDAVQQWIIERGLSLSGPPMEIYLTDDSDSDPSTWKTKICYPVSF